MSEQSTQSALVSGDSAHHSWFSNPLDWRFIDRLIALGVISLSVSVIFSVVIGFGLYWQSSQGGPAYLDVGTASTLLVILCCHSLLNLGLTLVAFKKRQDASDWPLFAYCIAFSYVLIVLALGYSTGTYFSDGIVLLLFGFALCLPLMDLDILSRVYVFAWLGFMLLMLLDFSKSIAFAPLFSDIPYGAESRPFFGWHAIRVAMSLSIFFILFFVTLPTTRRWRDREDLYREMSSTDGLTRLTNRRSFIDRSNAEFSKLQRMPGKLACIMIDLDYFKQVNDTHGHLAGDAVLVRVAEILADNARDYDEVGRYGGEEFAVLLPNTSKEDAAMIAERIRSAIEKDKIDIGELELQITASLGVASYPAEGINNINDLLKRADEALYEAKESSRNAVVVSKI